MVTKPGSAAKAGTRFYGAAYSRIAKGSEYKTTKRDNGPGICFARLNQELQEKRQRP